MTELSIGDCTDSAVARVREGEEIALTLATGTSSCSPTQVLDGLADSHDRRAGLE